MYLEVKNLKKSYGENGSYMQVLKGISTGVEKGEMCVIQGTSGSGKSTFLNCVGGLDTVESGSICVDGTEIVGLKQNELSEYRRANLGFIFQFYNLVPNLTVKENIQVCEYLTDQPLSLSDLLETLGLTEHQNKFPAQLSGGQQQRVSIARALVKSPDIILADEPTGNLDEENTLNTMSILKSISKECLVILVSHEKAIAKFFADRIIEIRDGEIVKDYANDAKGAYQKMDDANIYLKDMERQEIDDEFINLSLYREIPDPEEMPEQEKGKLHINLYNIHDFENSGADEE